MGFIDDLRQAVGFGDDNEDLPNWVGRLIGAEYTSPSGKTLQYEYADVSVTGRNKTSAFDFCDADGTYVQHRGTASRVFPLRMFFSGDDYDVVANAFELMIGERGVSKLYHPMYGLIDVVPFGRWRRIDRLVNGANYATFEMTFMRTIGIIYPTAQDDPQAETQKAVAAYNAAFAIQFPDKTDLDSALEEQSFLDKYNSLVKKASNVLKVIADKQQDVANDFQDIVDSINAGIDVLIADPLTLAFQTQILLGAPARALTDIRARLDAYKNLAGDIFSASDSIANPVFDGPGSPGSPGFGPGNDSQSPNTFHLYDLFVTGAVVGTILSSINNEFETATGALNAADEILALADQAFEWQDDNYQSIGSSNFSTQSNTDTGEGYQELQKAVALITGFLVDISFDLKQERVITLDRDRTIIDLSAELYKDVGDAAIDRIIENNDLNGPEILELPRGKQIVYYV